MEVKFKAFLLVLFVSISAELLRSPFPSGYSMGTLGAIIHDDIADNTHLSMVPAIHNRSFKCGADLSIVNYYDKMNNLCDRSLYQLSIGGYYRWKHILLKLNMSHFDALSTYFEQSASLSGDFYIIDIMALGIVFSGQRVSIRGVETGAHFTGVMGGSASIRLARVNISFKCRNLVVKKTQTPGVDPSLQFTCGIETPLSRIGSQGFLIEITPDEQKPFRWIMGEEIWLRNWLGAQIAIANNPLQVGLGIAVSISKGLFTGSIVNNEQLGWSRGLYLGWKK